MNVAQPRERHNIPNPALADGKPLQDGRPPLNGAAPSGQQRSLNRAQRFEDEKRRIIRSCFSKRDKDGSCMLMGISLQQIRNANAPSQQLRHSSWLPCFYDLNQRI